MLVDERVAAVERDGDLLLRFILTSLDRPVPACPGWDGAALLRHMADVHRFGAVNATAGQLVRQRAEVRAPDEINELVAFYREGLLGLAATLTATDPDRPAWTWSGTGQARAAWWSRRMAVETAVHRYDAEATAGTDPAPIATDLAVEGISEFMTDMIPASRARRPVELPGTLHVHTTDADCEWWIDLGAGTPARPEHAKADTALRGQASDLLTWLWNRSGPERLEVLGNADLIEAWPSLTW